MSSYLVAFDPSTNTDYFRLNNHSKRIFLRLFNEQFPGGEVKEEEEEKVYKKRPRIRRRIV